MSKVICIILGVLAALCGCSYNVTINGNSDTLTMTTSVPIMATVPVSAIP